MKRGFFISFNTIWGCRSQLVHQTLLPVLPLKTAVQLAAEIKGESKNEPYEKALARKKA